MFNYIGMNNISFSEKELSNLRGYLGQEGEEYLKALLTKKIVEVSKRDKKKQKRRENREKLNKQRLESNKVRAAEFRKDLINKQTNAEKQFKAILKSLYIKYDFQKIFYIGNSFRIVDFYLPEYNIVIEIDGEYHKKFKQFEKDELRTIQLENKGVGRVIRFNNQDVLDNTMCSRKIKKELNIH